MTIGEKIVKHYNIDDRGAAILHAARQTAADPDNLTIDDFAPYDELHIGRRSATKYFAGRLGLQSGAHVLDVGSGIGGPARYMVVNHGVSVTGVDLSPTFCEAATTISKALDLADKADFLPGSVLELPFEDMLFDAAYMIHVGMNIADKASVYEEVFRVLKPGSVFGLYDVFAGKGAEMDKLVYPLPWAQTAETSFLETMITVTGWLEQAGFIIELREDSRDFAIAAIEKLAGNKDAMSRERYPDRLLNLLGNIRNGLCGPWVIICRKP